MRGAGKAWHKGCFTCNLCNKRVDSSNLCEREGEIFCKACYGKNFGPKGFIIAYKWLSLVHKQNKHEFEKKPNNWRDVSNIQTGKQQEFLRYFFLSPIFLVSPS